MCFDNAIKAVKSNFCSSWRTTHLVREITTPVSRKRSNSIGFLGLSMRHIFWLSGVILLYIWSEIFLFSTSLDREGMFWLVSFLFGFSSFKSLALFCANDVFFSFSQKE